MSRTTSPTRASRRRAWAMEDLVLPVALGVVFGFAYWPLVQA